MTAYNIVSPGAMSAGQPEDISVVVANLQAIASVLNGNIDNANINAAAAIALSKLAGYPSDPTLFARGDGSWAAPSAAPPRLGVAALTITDWNNALDSGWYMGSNIPNQPFAGNVWFLGQVWQHNPSWVTQRVWTFTSGPESPIYERRLLNGSWSGWLAQASNTSYGTALPGSPVSGQEHILVDSVAASNYQWRFRYNGSNTGSYKWEYVGGQPAFVREDTLRATASNSYTVLDGSVDLLFYPPRAGVYLVEHTIEAHYQTLSGAPASIGLFNTGGQARAIATSLSGNPEILHQSVLMVIGGGGYARALYAAGSGAAYYASGRELRVTPIRVG